MTTTELAAFTENVGPIAQLVPFSMRNGTMAQAHSLLVRPTIGAAWHWTHIPHLPPSRAVHFVPAFIRMAYAMIMTHKPPTWDDAKIKKAAIILGVARATCTSMFDITSVDTIPGETGPVLFTAEVGTSQEVNLTVAEGAPEAAKVFLRAQLELDEEERAAIAAIHMCALGVLPLQGYSIIMTQHHYLSDPNSQSFKAFDVVERQNWTSSVVSTWYGSDKTDFRDVLFHKVGHPVLISLLTAWAYDGKIASMLKEAGAGPAAARLPALESELRAANSYMNLLQTITPMLNMFSGGINYELLVQAMTAVKLFPADAPEQELNIPLGTRIDPNVNTRAKARDFLASVLSNNSSIAAFCYGFYCAMHDASLLTATQATQDTLKTSHSLVKLRTQSSASYTSGVEAYGDYVQARNRLRTSGRIVMPLMEMSMGADVKMTPTVTVLTEEPRA